MTKSESRGPDRSCSFAVFFSCTARFVLPPDISTHLAVGLHFSQPSFLSLGFSILAMPYASSAITPRVPAPPPFLPTKPAPSLHLIPPLRFISPHLHLHHPLFFSPSLLPASLKDFFRLFSPLPLKEQVSLGVRWWALAETVFLGRGWAG